LIQQQQQKRGQPFYFRPKKKKSENKNVSCKWTARKTGRKECLGHVQSQPRFCFLKELSLKRSTEVEEKYEAVENELDKPFEKSRQALIQKQL